MTLSNFSEFEDVEKPGHNIIETLLHTLIPIARSITTSSVSGTGFINITLPEAV